MYRPMLEPMCRMHFCLRTRAGCLSHSWPSSYVPHKPWHETYLKLGTCDRVRSSSGRDRSRAK